MIQLFLKKKGFKFTILQVVEKEFINKYSRKWMTKQSY